MMFKKQQIDALVQLQSEKQQLDRELSLQQTEAQLIKDYVMRQGPYKIIITVYQLNDLQPKSLKLWKLQIDQKTACDAFVQIKIGNQTKITEIKKQNNNPIFDEQFYLQFQSMSIEQLDRAKILFNVYDTKLWGHSHSLIGSFQLDWTNVYFKRNHQIYRAWLTLYDPNNEIDGPVGYILANIAVLGQNDQITVHDSAFIKDPLVTIEDTITSPKIPLIDCSLSIEIYRAESLIPIDFISSELKAYVIAKFSGNKVRSSVVKSLNPEWNQCLKIGTQVPNKSKYITLQVRNQNILSSDEIIGILKIPFIEVFSEQQTKPKWGHLYGPPMAGKDIQPFMYASKMQIYGDKIGSHYRGRLLYKISGKKDIFTKNIKNKLVFKFPYRVIPVIPLKLFILRVDLIQGFSLPEIKFCYVQICIGQYTLKSSKFQIKDGFCQFYEMMEEKKINLPQNYDSMPDLILYFCDGLKQQNRIGFLRVKASQVFNSDPLYDSVKVHQLKIDRSINSKQIKSTCGFIACKLHLFSSAVSSPPRKHITKKIKLKDQYQLKIFLYRGQNLPPANQQGDCDPMIKFSFDQTKLVSQPIMSTYNPVWNQVLTKTVKIQNLFQLNMEKCLIADVYDYEQSQKHNYIGSFNVRINGLMKKKLKLQNNLKQKEELIQFIYSKPKWHYIVNPNVQVGNQVFGRVLISCSIFKKKYEINNREVLFKDLEQSYIFNRIKTQTFKKNINFFLIGIRDLKVSRQQSFITAIRKTAERKLKQVFIIPVITINCSHTNNEKEQSNHELFKLKSQGCQINKIYRFRQVLIPKNKLLSSFVDFKITDQKGKYVYGSNSINLKTFKNIFNEEVQEASKAKGAENMDILDVESLEVNLKKLNLLNKIKQKNKIQQQNANFISKKRVKVCNQKDLIAPAQIQNLTKEKLPDPEAIIQMQNLLKQFQQQFQATEQDQGYLYGYVKNNMVNSSSNNSNQIMMMSVGNKEYNHIDYQMSKFGIQQRGKEEKGQQGQQQFQVNDEEELLIGEIKQSSYKGKETKRRLKGMQREQDQGSLEHKPSSKVRQRDRNHQNTSANRTGQEMIQGQTKTQNLAQGSKRLKSGILQLSLKRNSQKKGQIIQNFDLNQSLALSQNLYAQKAIKYGEVEEGLKLQEQHMKYAVHKNQEYKYASAVKLSLFKWIRREAYKQKQTYQDYDTDEEQKLDIIPEWYKGRKILSNDLQHFLSSNRTIENVNIYRGRKIQGLQTRVKQKVGTVKMIVLSGQDKHQLQNTAKYYERLLRQKQFSCRIYVLKGKSLLTTNLQKPNTYLKFTYGQKVTSYKDTIVKQQNNPQYYLSHEEWIKLPGPSTIKIQVMEVVYLVGKVGDHLAKDRLIGYTQIDMEDRYFMKKWHLLDRKPIQLRNLFSQYGIGTQGRLQTWMQLVQKKKWLVTPMIKITPPPWDEYQLRVIVWSTKQCVFKNQQLQSNDVFVRGQIGGGNYQETDIHWACRSVGNFNYRFKFNIFYPSKPQDMYSDVFIVQIWDKDVIGYNNLIGQCKINLNKMHKIIQKAVKRKKPVVASKKIIQKNMTLTDKFWFDVYNHREKDQFGQLQSQGKAQLSFQLVPMQMANKQRTNGYGRSQPNVYPTLAAPSGRLNFNFLKPLDFLKQLLGPNMYRSVCTRFLCLILIVVLVLMFLQFGTSIVAGLVARG